MPEKSRVTLEIVLDARKYPLRCDQALSLFLGCGLRQARRYCHAGQVFLDGRRASKGDLVTGREHLVLRREEPVFLSAQYANAVRVVQSQGDFAALEKPAHMHTVQGRAAYCVQGFLPNLGFSDWQLLNRLDFLTSGLVLLGGSERAAHTYSLWQRQGQVYKFYLALAHGQVSSCVLRGRIDDAQRKKSRVFPEEDARARWTWVQPLAHQNGDTYVLIGILRGRRHHIRAHMASAGHPLWGDPLYGSGESPNLFLHHICLRMPDFEACSFPDWGGVVLSQEEVYAVCTAAFFTLSS